LEIDSFIIVRNIAGHTHRDATEEVFRKPCLCDRKRDGKQNKRNGKRLEPIYVSCEDQKKKDELLSKGRKRKVYDEGGKK
jgi:hypothetical protein